MVKCKPVIHIYLKEEEINSLSHVVEFLGEFCQQTEGYYCEKDCPLRNDGKSCIADLCKKLLSKAENEE